MAEREIKVGLMSYVRADGPPDTVLWGFAINGAKVDVHDDDLERFDRLNGVVATVAPPLDLADGSELDDPAEPPRSGRGSGSEVWVAYARTLGLEVEDDASRDDVIDLVDSSK